MNIFSASLTNRPKMKICKDCDLPTPEAIKFRIEQIKKENGGVLSPAQYSRIAALRARLPKDPNVTVLAPAIDPNLLVSKSDIDEFGKSPLAYA